MDQNSSNNSPQQASQLQATPLPVQPVSKMELFKMWLPKLLLIIGILVIIAELVIYAPKIISIFQGKGAASIENAASQTGSKLRLTAPKSEFKVGESFKVSVVLDTNGNNVQSSDVVLKFNPNLVEVDTSSGIISGKIFNNFSLADINNKQGVVRISGTNGISKDGFSGLGEMATLVFKAKSVGSTNINIEYTPDSTADSNIVSADSTLDVLKSVGNLNITIK